MFSRARRETGHGGPRVKSDRRRPSSKAVVGVEPLEGRMLLSYLVVVKNHKVIPVHGGDARVAEPLFSNGLAFKKQPHFYPFYTGPRTPSLDGVSATAVVSGNRVTDGTLTLTGTVAGPIIAKPKTASQEAIYTFAIDRGGAAKTGPFPGRTSHPLRRRGRRPNVTPRHPQAIPPTCRSTTQLPISLWRRPQSTLSPSSVKIKGDTITITRPTGHLDEPIRSHRPARPSTSGTSTSSHASHRHTVPARTVTTALPASPLRTRCFRSIYSISASKGDLSLEPRARPHSGARAASIRTWLVTNKLGCNRAPWLDCSHFFKHFRRTNPRRHLAFPPILGTPLHHHPRSSCQYGPSFKIGGCPTPTGGCTTGESGALAFCMTVYQSGLSSLSPLTYAPLGRSSPSYAGPPPPSVEAPPRG